MQKRFLIIAVAIVSLCLGGVVSAATATWTGSFSSNFMEQYNWAPELIPATADILTVGPGIYFQPVFDPGAGVSSRVTYIGVDLAGGFMTFTSGTMRMDGDTSSESLFVRNGSLTTDGVLVNGGTLDLRKGLYVGRDNNLGRMTVTSGNVIVAGITTVGYGRNAGPQTLSGVLNVWGGTVDMGTGLRMDPVIGLSGAGKECSGKIDIRGTGVAKIDLGTGTVTNKSQLTSLIKIGRIVSEPGYAPALADVNDAGVMSVLVTAQRVYYATGPSPAANGGTIQYTSSQTLSWIKPFPRAGGDTVTSDVYFGTTNPPTTLVASNISGNSVTVTTVPEQQYFWKVDSRDSNGGSPIVTPTPYADFSDTWTFDTKVAPTVTVGTSGGKQAAFKSGTDPNTIVTLAATATDDGYPGALTYEWIPASPLDANMTFTPSKFVRNPVVSLNVMTAPNSSMTLLGGTTTTSYSDGFYHAELRVSDGAHTTAAVITVRVYPAPTAGSSTYCDAAQWVNAGFLAGDVNQDCKVDQKDLAAVVSQWLACTSLDCL